MTVVANVRLLRERLLRVCHRGMCVRARARACACASRTEFAINGQDDVANLEAGTRSREAAHHADHDAPEARLVVVDEGQADVPEGTIDGEGLSRKHRKQASITVSSGGVFVAAVAWQSG